jgi:hypothetical protein
MMQKTLFENENLTEPQNPAFCIGAVSRSALLFGDCLIHSRDAVRSFDVCAPSHTQVFRWLINKHGVIANIIYDNEMNNYFFEYCYLGSGFKKSFLPLQANSEDDIDYDYGRFDSYHEAANACILNIVEYIKERKRNVKG